MTKRIGTSLLRSTAFHPQTDGQAENSNKTVTTFLTAFATHHTDEWDRLLPLAEFAYNASPHRTTKEVPFEADLGYISRLPLDAIVDAAHAPTTIPKASTLRGRAFAEKLQRLLYSVQDEIRAA